MAEHFRHRAEILRFIEYMDVGTTNRWDPDEVLTTAEIRTAIAARWPLESLAPELPRRGGDALPLSRRRRRDRIDPLRERALLRHVHAARGYPPTEGSTPACSQQRAPTCARSCAPARATGSLRSGSKRCGVSASDRYSAERAGLREAASRPNPRPRIEMSYIGG